MRNKIKIKELEGRVKELENTLVHNNIVMKLNELKLKSELHNSIANRLWDRCNGDKSTITAYMNFIYRMKTLQDDINLYVEYMTLPEDMGVLVHRPQKDTLRIQLDKDIMPVYWDEPNLIRRRLERYNDYLYFDELTEESFKNGYYVEYQGDYFWKEDDIPYQDKYKELIKCIRKLLKAIICTIESYDELQQRFPKLVKLIERNIEVCYIKIEELENKE